MSDLKLPGEVTDTKKRNFLIRVAVWVLVGGVGLYLVVSGIIGILVKAS